MSPRPDTHDSNSAAGSSTSVVMASTPSTAQANQAAKPGIEGAGAGADDLKVEGVAVAVVADNPYLAGLNKKTRGLKKKLEKIRKTESLSASGKHLNEEQLRLLDTKPLMEFALAEHERVKVAMEAVAKELEDQAKADRADNLPPPPAPGSTGLSIPAPLPEEPAGALSIPPVVDNRVAIGDALEAVAEVEGQATPPPEGEGAASGTVVESLPPPAVVQTETVGVCTEPLHREDAEAQTDLSGPPPPAGLDPGEVSAAVSAAAVLASEEKDKAAEEGFDRGVEAGRAEATAGVSKLLRVLHVASRFEAKGERLPTAVDFFSKVLLGKTVPPDEADFDDCLEQSVERAALYLDPSNASREVAPGINFEKLDEMVSTLREQIIAGPDSTTQGPTFNFFADASPKRPEDNIVVTASQDPLTLPVNSSFSSHPSAPAPPVRGGEGVPGYHPILPPSAPPTPGHNRQQQQKQQQVMGLPLPGRLVPPPPPPSHPHPVPTVNADEALSAQSSLGPLVGNDDAILRSPTAGQLGRQASQMEEGVLPPVVTQNQSQNHPQHRPPPNAPPAADVALPQRERRLKPCPTGSAPSYPPSVPFTNNYAPQQPLHPTMVSPPPPPLRHPQQLRSPFPQQPTPPVTPGHMGQGIGPPMPSPSPPAPAPHVTGPRGGSPNLSYRGGWGYGQPPQQAQVVQQQQQQQHHHALRPPLHPSQPSMRPNQATVGVGAPWGDVSPPIYPVRPILPPSLHPLNSGALLPQAGGSVEVQDALSGNFSLTAPQLTSQNAPYTSPLHGPSPHPGPMTVTGSAISGQWSGASSGTPPPGHVAPAVDLERGMTSPWQGLPKDGGDAAPPGMSGTGAVSEMGTGNSGDSPSLAVGLLDVPMEEVVGGVDRGVEEQRHVQTDNIDTIVAPITEASVVQPPAPGAPSPEANNDVAVSNGQVFADSDEVATAGALKPRGGSSKGGRGASSRSRGGRRGEPRNDGSNSGHLTGKDSDDQSRGSQIQKSAAAGEGTVVSPTISQQAPNVQDQVQRHDALQKGGRVQRRPREQGRGQQCQRQEQASREQQQQQQNQTGFQGQTPDGPPLPQAVRVAGQDGRRAVPYSKGRNNNNTKSQSSPAKSTWSHGAPAAQAPSSNAELTLAVKAPALAPVPTSWADEEPSPRRHPPPHQHQYQQQQRPSGGFSGRNRHHLSQQQQQQPKTPADRQRVSEVKGGQTQGQGYGYAPSHEVGPTQQQQQQQQQGGKISQKHRQGRANYIANGGGAANVSRPREQQQTQQVFPDRGQSSAGSDGVLPNGQHHRTEDGGVRASSKVTVQNNGRASNSNSNVGAPQGVGPRKNRTAPSRRRNGGAAGGTGSGGRGSQQQQQQQGVTQRA